MHGEFDGNVSDARSVRAFFSFPDLYVVVLKLRRTDALVPQLLIQRMEEAITRGKRTVRPFRNPEPSQKVLSLRKMFSMPLDHCGIGRECGGHGGGREFQTSDTSSFKCLLFCER